jgi:hypothetical protein
MWLYCKHSPPFYLAAELLLRKGKIIICQEKKEGVKFR